MAVTRVDQHAFRLRDVAGLSIRPRRFYVRQMLRFDQLFPCRVIACQLLLCGLSLSEAGDCHNRN